VTAHDHRTYVDGCYRCELSRDEVADATPEDVIAAELRVQDTDGYLLVQYNERAHTMINTLTAAGYAVVPAADVDAAAPSWRQIAQDDYAALVELKAERDAAVDAAARLRAENEALRADARCPSVQHGQSSQYDRMHRCRLVAGHAGAHEARTTGSSLVAWGHDDTVDTVPVEVLRAALAAAAVGSVDPEGERTTLGAHEAAQVLQSWHSPDSDRVRPRRTHERLPVAWAAERPWDAPADADLGDDGYSFRGDR
jgi:hypothetical protein